MTRQEFALSPLQAGSACEPAPDMARGRAASLDPGSKEVRAPLAIRQWLFWGGVGETRAGSNPAFGTIPDETGHYWEETRMCRRMPSGVRWAFWIGWTGRGKGFLIPRGFERLQRDSLGSKIFPFTWNYAASSACRPPPRIGLKSINTPRTDLRGAGQGSGHASSGMPSSSATGKSWNTACRCSSFAPSVRDA